MRDLGTSFIATTERSPGATAVVDGALRLTFAQWQARVQAVRAGLNGLGLARGDHLLMVLQNRWEMATLHWACQAAGIISTPVNWRAKADEIDFYLDNSGARAIAFEQVSADAVAASPRAAAVPRISVGDSGAASASFGQMLEEAGGDEPSAAGPDDISVMLYTSGTTGKPKGVPRTHRAERTAAVAHVAQNRYGHGERTVGVMPLYHTMGVRSLLSMSLIDGCFVCMPRFEPGRMLELIARERITNLYLVPTLYHDLIEHEAFASTDVSSVRKLGFAGAPMTDALLKRLNAAFEPDLFVNHYGSSEIYTFTISQDAVAKPGCAGRAGINQRIRVVKLGEADPQGHAATGEEGQIIASLDSEEAFRGYWQRPDADAKSIHDGWYFTGDTGYFDAEGDLFVTGRVDDMIITGGENVSPVEVESVLSLHPAVGDVAVAGVRDERWGQRVTAFIRRSAEVTPGELDRYCRESTLADFKRPREYVFVREVPKSPVGKILRRMLVAGEYESEQ